MTAEEAVAVLADIHGNRWALEAVLGDASRRGVSRFVNLGDVFYGPLDPAGTARLLLPLDPPSVRGNEDRLVTERNAASSGPTLSFTRAALGPEAAAWLEPLPLAAVAFDDLFLCHGTPERDDEYLLRRVGPSGARFRPAGDVAARLAGVRQPVLLCAHDHLPAVVRPEKGPLIVNPGSVGCPAFDDDHPFPHVMENGSPEARYALLDRNGAGGWSARLLAVPYDHESAARAAERNGRPDWAVWIRTGWARAGGTSA